MSKETKEEIMNAFSALPKELQKGIAIGLAAGMEAGKTADKPTETEANA